MTELHTKTMTKTDSPLVLSAFRFLNSTSSEDCLYLNIWSPSQEDQFFPVLVYIHGGAFAYGGIATEELDALALAAQQEVVVVTIQYRLGIFGFLSLDGKEPKGNMGLYDQREALKWIHTNINKFGGDQDLITVIGHGAGIRSVCLAQFKLYSSLGAVSVGLHMMTSDSKFFFQRTILQGFGLFWNKDIYSQSKKFSKKFIEDIDCTNAPDIRKCIKTKNVDRLLEVQQEILEDNPVAFAPVIPSDFVSLLPTEAKDSFEFQIDFMFGLNSEDDSLFLTTLRNAEEEGKTTEEDEEKETENKDQGSEETEEKEEEEDPVERSTSKPILAVTTAPPTTTTEDSTSSSTSTTTESKNKTSEALEKEETTETEKEEKEDDSEGEGTEESEGEGEDESTDEERRRRRKREVDEHVTKVVCPLIKFADQIVESNRSVYIYQLNEFSSYHDEIVFAMGYPLKFKSLYDYDELQFSKRVMKNWAQFATNGDLSESDDKWKSYTKENQMFLKMSISSISSDKLDRNQCNTEVMISQ